MAPKSAVVRGATLVLMASSLALAGCGSLLPGGNRSATTNASTGIGVNAYLWRATLDTFSFMPLSSADPWGGVINYDWYTDPASPNERFKATVLILDTRLRADALNVSLVKQVRGPNGDWVAAPVTPQTETDLENAILTRARQLNLADAR